MVPNLGVSYACTAIEQAHIGRPGGSDRLSQLLAVLLSLQSPSVDSCVKKSRKVVVLIEQQERGQLKTGGLVRARKRKKCLLIVEDLQPGEGASCRTWCTAAVDSDSHALVVCSVDV